MMLALGEVFTGWPIEDEDDIPAAGAATGGALGELLARIRLFNGNEL